MIYPVVFRTYGQWTGRFEVVGVYTTIEKAQAKLDAIEAKLREGDQTWTSVERSPMGLATGGKGGVSVQPGSWSIEPGLEPGLEPDT